MLVNSLKVACLKICNHIARKETVRFGLELSCSGPTITVVREHYTVGGLIQDPLSVPKAGRPRFLMVVRGCFFYNISALFGPY